jgi:hypothetical protein
MVRITPERVQLIVAHYHHRQIALSIMVPAWLELMLCDCSGCEWAAWYVSRRPS